MQTKEHLQDWPRRTIGEPKLQTMWRLDTLLTLLIITGIVKHSEGRVVSLLQTMCSLPVRNTWDFVLHKVEDAKILC